MSKAMLKKTFAGLFAAALIVTVVAVMRHDADLITLDNAYVSGRVLRISASTDGTVQAYAAKRAAYVRKGERLFNIGDIDNAARLKEYRELLRIAIEDELQACREVASARTSLDRAHTNAGFVDGNLQRVKSLEQVGMMTREMLEKRQLEVAMSTLDTTAAQQELARSADKNRLPVLQRPKVQHAVAKLQAAFNQAYAADVLAPADGYIYELLTYSGQYVEKGDKLMVLIPKEEQVIEANVLESEIAVIAPGNAVTVVPDVGGGKQTYSGVIQSIVPSVAATFSQLPRNNLDSNWIKTSQRIPVLITLAAPERNSAPLPLGSSVKVTVKVGQARQGATAPLAGAKASAGTSTEESMEQQQARRFSSYLGLVMAAYPGSGARLRSCH